MFQFTNLLQRTRGIHQAYLDNYVTVFAPSNDAMNQYQGLQDENFILHHMGNTDILLHLMIFFIELNWF